MNNKFYSQRYNNFTYNTYKDQKSIYNQKDDKDNVLQKMQMSLNNFLTNLKKNENIENMDSFPNPNEQRTIDIEKSLNFNNQNINQNKNIFNNIQTKNNPSEVFPISKEKSESSLIKNNNLFTNIQNNNFYRSPYNQDRYKKGISPYSNTLYSFHTYNKSNNINKNIKNVNKNLNNVSDIIIKNDINNRAELFVNNYNLNIKKNQRSNTQTNSILKTNNILINENSSHSGEENNTILQNSINNVKININNNNNINNSGINKNIEAKSPINNNDDSFKKIVQKIKEKKAAELQLKEKGNQTIKENNITNLKNININTRNNETNNLYTSNKTENLNNINTLNSIKRQNEQKLISMNNEILLNSNKVKKNKSKQIKENILSVSKTYADKNDNLLSNSTILNTKKNIFLDSNLIKKEYSKEKDNDLNKTNYRKYKKHIEDKIILDEDIYNSIKNNNNLFNNINIQKDNNINKNEKKNKANKKQEELKELMKQKNNINEDKNNNTGRLTNSINIKKDNEEIKTEWMKTYSGTNYINIDDINNINNNNILYNKIKKDEENHIIIDTLNEKNNININNINDKIKISKNYFEIIQNNNPMMQKYIKDIEEKNKLLEKLIIENNSLKEKIVSKDNEIQQLNNYKNTYMGWDSNKFLQKIKDLESKLVESKNIKGQLNILKSQKTNLNKEFSKYKDMAESLKKENDRLVKQKDEFKKQRDILNNEIKILKINNLGFHNNKNNFSKTISRQRLLVSKKDKSNEKKFSNKNKKKTIDKHFDTIQNAILTNSISKESSISQNNNNNIIVNNDNFTFIGIKRINNIFDNDNYNIDNNDIIDINIDKNKELEKIIYEKNNEILNYKIKIETLQKEIKENKDNDNKDIKKNNTEKSKPKKAKINNLKTEENKSNNNNNVNIKKYLDEINELKNNIKKLENDKTNLKNKIENIENKKNNNNNLHKQNEELKKQIIYTNNQMKSLKTKSSEFDEFFMMTKSFIKMIKPTNDNEKDLYFKLKNQIEYLEKEKITK